MMREDLFGDDPADQGSVLARPAFEPSRRAGLARLDAFAPCAGRRYAGLRNHDFGPDRRSNISALSPWIRRRLITEQEVLTATLARHAPSTAEKFIQEVFWRTYFKGWLEQRPSVWRRYQAGLARALADLEAETSLAARYRDAVAGRTGVDCFDAWALELVDTGYLHNHARMWFASIWIFTLRLPWELGADFFLRHLLDGDPASNTLSWRWVGGLHTKGKTYLARRDNIAKYTDGRFSPSGLALSAEPLVEADAHPRRPIPVAEAPPDADYLLLITEEDCQIAAGLKRPASAALGLLATEDRSPEPSSAPAQRFARGAVADALESAGGGGAISPRSDAEWTETIAAAATKAGTRDVVTGYAPVGPVADRLARAKETLAGHGVAVHQIRRAYDTLSWPHATRGFFALKQKIPSILSGLGLTR